MAILSQSCLAWDVIVQFEGIAHLCQFNFFLAQSQLCRGKYYAQGKCPNTISS